MPKYLATRCYETVIEAEDMVDALDFAADLSSTDFDLVFSDVEVVD